jgi:hypothetical protein
VHSPQIPPVQVVGAEQLAGQAVQLSPKASGWHGASAHPGNATSAYSTALNDSMLCRVVNTNGASRTSTTRAKVRCGAAKAQ